MRMLTEKRLQEMREELERRRQPGYAEFARRQFWQFAACAAGCLAVIFILGRGGHGLTGALHQPLELAVLCVCFGAFLLSVAVAMVRWLDVRRSRLSPTG